MTDREALKLALEALQEPHPGIRTNYGDALTYREKIKNATIAINEALAQPAQHFNPDWDAMAVMVEEQQRMAKRIEELEQALAQRPWVGLTDEEVNWFGWHGTGIRAVEAKLKELNT